MVKNHLKSVAAPKTWPISRKKHVFTTKPNPGAHPYKLGIPLKIAFIELLDLVKTDREMSYALNKKEVFVDNKKRKDSRFIVGLFDVISLPILKKHFRISLTKLGKITANEIKEEESKFKPMKILGKRLVKGKYQLNLTGSRCILTEDKVYKVGDSLLVELPSQNILEHLPLEKDNFVYIFKGKYTGKSGIIKNIDNDSVTVQINPKEIIQTQKSYAFVVGKDKSKITF